MSLSRFINHENDFPNGSSTRRPRIRVSLRTAATLPAPHPPPPAGGVRSPPYRASPCPGSGICLHSGPGGSGICLHSGPVSSGRDTPASGGAPPSPAAPWEISWCTERRHPFPAGHGALIQCHRGNGLLPSPQLGSTTYPLPPLTGPPAVTRILCVRPAPRPRPPSIRRRPAQPSPALPCPVDSDMNYWRRRLRSARGESLVCGVGMGAQSDAVIMRLQPWARP